MSHCPTGNVELEVSIYFWSIIGTVDGNFPHMYGPVWWLPNFSRLGSLEGETRVSAAAATTRTRSPRVEKELLDISMLSLGKSIHCRPTLARINEMRITADPELDHELVLIRLNETLMKVVKKPCCSIRIFY